MQGLGWKNNYKSGKGVDTITSGLEGAWTSTPTQWSNGYFEILFEYDWKLTKSPAGAQQWKPTDPSAADTVPDAHDPNQSHAPMMFTTDLALKIDPAYAKISRRFYENPDEFALAFAKAWYKLTHRDMGPHVRLLGPEVPPAQLWQDPVPSVDHDLIGKAGIAQLKSMILETGLGTDELVLAAWSSASTYRDTDKRGGANGARVRLAPQKDWSANQPEQLAKVISVLEGLQTTFNADQRFGVQVSLADMIVLGGCTAIEKAAGEAGYDVEVPFTPGRTDATDEMTDADSFDVLEPKVDGFRNFYGHFSGKGDPAEAMLIEKASLLSLNAPEMTALVGGMRALGATVGPKGLGQFTERPGQLTNDFFVNLLDMNTHWQKSEICDHFFEGIDRETGDLKWTASSVDLVFGSNSQLRAIAEVYRSDDGEALMVDDFIAAWNKVMNLGRFDLER